MDRINNGILADTSVWIEFFKLNSPTGNKLEELIIENSVWVCGVVMFELLQGVKTDEEKSKILGTLSSLQYAEMSKSLWQTAGELSAGLRKKGLQIPSSDIFIASTAIRHNLYVFTLDKHFQQIPGVKVYT